jgi:FkbM family methyltransferase
MTAQQPASGAPVGTIQKLAWRLRPAKVRAGMRRRVFEQVMERTSLRPVPGLLQLGTFYGGWIVPGELIQPGWICYCVGAGGDVSFDLALVQRYGALSRSFEPVQQYVEAALQQGDGVEGFTAHQAAITTSDGPLRMGITHDPRSQSVSSAGLYEARDFIELPGRTLPSLMAELGDPRIDLLKLDVEGAEYELMPTLDLSQLGVKVLAIQLHHTGTIADARRIVSSLREQGYDPVACRVSVKITFARRDLL